MPKFSDDWNKNQIKENNSCYNYALDKKSTGKKGKNLNPGDASGKTIHTPHDCPKLVAAIDADLKLGEGDKTDKSKKCPEKCWKILCVLAPGAQPDPDFHFYRQDDDGTWSHKRGSEKATNIGVDGKAIKDPEKDAKALKPSYSKVCGYFCVCPDKTKVIDVAMLGPDLGAQGFASAELADSTIVRLGSAAIYVPLGRVCVTFDFVKETMDQTPIDEAGVMASLFSGRGNPSWDLSPPQVEDLGLRISSLPEFEEWETAKAFGGYRVNGVVSTDDEMWATDGGIWRIEPSGTEWSTPDTIGLGSELDAQLAQKFPWYSSGNRAS